MATDSASKPPSAPSPGIVTLRTPRRPQRSKPAEGSVVQGNPRFTSWDYFTDPSQQFAVGIWAATPGSWRVSYTECEFCHLLTGQVTITADGGESWQFSAGESFVIPAGFAGTWEVVESCRKLYAIFEAKMSSGLAVVPGPP